MNIKAQASFELLLILSFSLTLTILAAGYYVMYSQEATDELNKAQLDRIFDDVMNKVSRVYFAGNGNRITIEATIPQGVNQITIENGTTGGGINFNYLNISYVGDGGNIVESLYFPEELFIYLNCTSSCTYTGNRGIFDRQHTGSGAKRIRVESEGDIVSIDFIQRT